ncbi:NUDIX domain-containing protein [Sphingobium tyrosinilyticum]|uniref:NUDIX domain-containing protein n=1 Tax=Sphingobium tyrosinilyticum TaxID=2715436 RepID=A0ABV9F0H0_9SPHN
MASQISAGPLPYRWHAGTLQVFLVHPGGPYWQRKDDGAWQIAKGAALPGEALHNAALREFEEEVGARPAGKPWPETALSMRVGPAVREPIVPQQRL